MKKVTAIIIFLILSAGIVTLFFYKEKGEILNPLSQGIIKVKEKPLEKYTFENLKNRTFEPSEITFGRILKDEKDFSASVFYFNVDGQKVSGLASVPKKEGVYPVIVMFRGYIDREKYTTGDGTRRAGEVFAANNFITLAPDFLGYGESASPSANPMEERFQTYTTALTLLASLGNLNQALGQINAEIKVDSEKVGIWGHSNGGQIALSVLEITGKAYPTVLWAPVSKPFPYSVLYYTDDFDDHGKMLRRVIADFEKDYDVEKYSLTNFLDWIQAPIQLHQSGDDEAVPKRWSEELLGELERLDKDVTYFSYPGDGHNFARGSWSSVVVRNISFYKEHFK